MGGPPKLPVPPQPPACANCVSSVQATGAAAVQSPFNMLRSSNGQMRIDLPNTSVITNPATQQAIILNHITKQAQILPLQQQQPGMPPPGMPQAPGMAIPGMPQAPQVTVQNLGTSLIEGHPVDGVRYTMQAAGVQMPQPPGTPKPPQAPGMPQPPGMPHAPGVPPPPTVSEIWTSTQLKMPVLTKVTTPGGVQTTYCKPAPAPEPNPTAFQIPPGYKIVGS